MGDNNLNTNRNTFGYVKSIFLCPEENKQTEEINKAQENCKREKPIIYVI